MRKLILLVFVSIFLLFPNYQTDLDNMPYAGDEIQYWEIGYGIFSSGEYKREIINSSIDENSKLELGYRRGEPIYPLLIATVLKIHNFSNDISIENCDSINCDVFDQEVRMLVFVFYLLKISIVVLAFKNLIQRFSSPFSFILSLTLLLMLPNEYKDLITVFLLTLGIHNYHKQNNWSLIIFSILPLSNAVFLYILPFVFVIYFYLKKQSMKKWSITILVLLLPSLLWMTRNYLNFNEFSLTGRAAEVLSIRAEYSANNFEQIRAGYIFYTPSKPFIFGAIQGNFWNYVMTSGSDIVYDRSNPMSSYKRAKNLTGVVGSKLEKQSFESKTYIEQQKILNTVSIDLIRENITQHFLLSTVFGYRGMFPAINFDFTEFYSIPEGITQFVKEIFSLLRLVFIPYGLIKSLINFYNKKVSFSSLLLIILWGFFAFFTHFIPRYATYLLIPAVLFIANIDKEEA